MRKGVSLVEQVEVAPLSDHPAAIPEVAGWWCAEWGVPQRHASFNDYVREIATRDVGALPLHLLALHASRPVGVATLKEKSPLQSQFPDADCWLSGVYVSPALRGGGIATMLCSKMLEVAAARGAARIFLQTEAVDGGLYARLGWKPVDVIESDGSRVLIMANDIA